VPLWPRHAIEPRFGSDRRALATLFDQDAEELRRRVQPRLDSRHRTGLAPSNVAQDLFADVGHERKNRP
jgi:hypothetical protein